MSQVIDMFIIGAQKAGTTSLLRYLSQHPALCAHPQSEMVYFLSPKERSQAFDLARQRYYGNCRNEQRKLAKHVMLMLSSEGLQRLRAHNPKVKLVICVRDPVERAYSAYWYARRMGWEPLTSFEAALAAEESRHREDWFRWRSCLYRHHGQYIDHLRRVEAIFDKEQLRVLVLEELRQHPKRYFRELFAWLGLDPDVTVHTDRPHNTAKRARSEFTSQVLAGFFSPRNRLKNAIRPLFSDRLAHSLRSRLYRFNESTEKPPAMLDATRQELANYFAPFNRELAKHLGRERLYEPQPD